MLWVLLRFAPAVLLAVLNTWIIIEFKRISRRRLLLSQGISCEVSAIPSQSYLEGNANTTVVNHSPTNGQVEPEPAATDATLVTTTATNPTTATSTVTSLSEISPPLGREERRMENTVLSSNGHVHRTDHKAVDNSHVTGNGYRVDTAGGDIASTRNSSGKSITRSRGEKETIGLSMINVSGDYDGSQVIPTNTTH